MKREAEEKKLGEGRVPDVRTRGGRPVQSLEVLAVGSRFVAKATVGWYGAATAATRRAGAPLSAAGPAIGAPIDGGRCIAFYDVEGDKKLETHAALRGGLGKKSPKGTLGNNCVESSSGRLMTDTDTDTDHLRPIPTA